MATELFQARIEKELIDQAREVSEQIGTTPGEIVRIMFKQLVKRRAIPFPIQADSPEDDVIVRSNAERARLWDEL